MAALSILVLLAGLTPQISPARPSVIPRIPPPAPTPRPSTTPNTPPRVNVAPRLSSANAPKTPLLKRNPFAYSPRPFSIAPKLGLTCNYTVRAMRLNQKDYSFQDTGRDLPAVRTGTVRLDFLPRETVDTNSGPVSYDPVNVSGSTERYLSNGVHAFKPPNSLGFSNFDWPPLPKSNGLSLPTFSGSGPYPVIWYQDPGLNFKTGEIFWHYLETGSGWETQIQGQCV